MAEYEVSVEASFKARHAVKLSDGSMEASHDHLWTVVATFRSRRLLQPMAVVVDFVAARQALFELVRPLDGADLNNFPLLTQSSSAEKVAECLALELTGKLDTGRASLYRVSVTEAPGCVATYYPDGA